MNLKKCGLTYSNFYYYLLMALPLLLLYLLFFVIPVVSSIFFSFTNFNGINFAGVKMMGLKNYEVALTSDPTFWLAMRNTFQFALIMTLLQNGFAILFAVALNTKMRSRNLLRTLIYAPCMLSPIVVAFIWQFLYLPDGVFNQVLQSVGLGDLAQIWLGNKDTAIYCVIIANVWRWVGYSATIYLANLQSISEDVLEAAKIDGAGRWTTFWKITFPLLAPTFTINVTLAFTQSLKVFDIVYAMTGGGPQGATETAGTYVVKMMNNNLHGYASAMTVILMVLIIFFGQVLTRTLKKREEAIS